MTNDFRSYNVIYIVYDRKNENRWSLLITRYSLLVIQTPYNVCADAMFFQKLCQENMCQENMVVLLLIDLQSWTKYVAKIPF